MLRALAATCLLSGCVLSHAQGAHRSRTDVFSADQFRTAHASGIVLDWDSGAVIAEAGMQVRRASAPGSVLKPLMLSYALQHGIVSGTTRVYCRRSLHVGDRALPCTHSADQPMLDAETALAESCNTWFAAMARRMSAEDVRAVLRTLNVSQTAPSLNEPDARALAVLGLEYSNTTVARLAMAYRALLRDEPHTSPAWLGLQDSVAFGMASNARVTSASVMGKTGTARDADAWWTHGWFAGAVPGRFVIVVYVPRGDGGVAASLAGETMNTLLRGAR